MMSLIRETTENNQKSRHSCITIVVGEVSLLLLVVFMAVMSGGITRFTDFFDILFILVILAMDFSFSNVYHFNYYNPTNLKHSRGTRSQSFRCLPSLTLWPYYKCYLTSGSYQIENDKGIFHGIV